MRNYGIAIVGAGNVARAHLQAIRSHPQASLVAMCDQDLARCQSWVAEAGVDCAVHSALDPLLARNDVDIVVLCTPNYLHTAQAIQAVRAGKHVVIEKPVALNLADLRALEAAVRASGVTTMVSFVLRWNPAVRMARHLIDEGAVGRVFMVETCYWHATPRAVEGHWMTSREAAGSVFLMGGCHAVDTARWLAGADVVEVSAYRTSGNKTWFGYDPTAVALVRFANGAIGRISASMECVMPYAFNITVMGDRGTIRDNRLYSHLFPGQTDFATIPSVLPDNGDPRHHPFTDELAELIACLDAGRQPALNVAGVVNTHEVCLAVDLSADQGRPVALPLAG